MIARQHGNARLGGLLIVFALVAFVALGIPSRMLTRWAYALEQGKLRASSEELAAINQDLARVQEVSHAFRLVAKLARPGVVNIHVAGDEEVRKELGKLMRERSELQEQISTMARQLAHETGKQPSAKDIVELYNRLQALESQIETLLERLGSNAGSGIIFDDEGHILTNNHVVAGRSEIRVRLPDEREYDATLVGSDPKTDLAMIRIDAADLHPLKFGDSGGIEVGDWVIAVGAPFDLSQTVTHGIISAKGRTDVVPRRGILYQNFLQTDAAINPGNSGGPLLNLRGEVVGVNTAIATHGENYNAGIAFAIPSNMAVRIASQLKRTGEVVRGWLGITMGELTAADREVLGINRRDGVLVAAIVERGPAEQAGLRVEDVILTVNGRPVSNMDELRSAVADVVPGHAAALSLLRDGKPVETSVTMGRRPSDAELDEIVERSRPGRELPDLGLYVRTLLPTVARRLGYSETARGALVVAVADDQFQQIPIVPGQLIVACDGQSVETVAALSHALRSSDRSGMVKLEVVGPDGERRVVRYGRR